LISSFLQLNKYLRI